MPPRRATARLSKACGYCRSKKVKCDGASPCGNCLDRSNECVYPPKSRRRRKHRNTDGRPSPAVDDDAPMPIGEIWVQERGCNDYDVNNHASAATPAESFPSLKPQQPPDPASQQQTWAAQSTEVADAVASWSFSTQGGPSLEGAAHNTTGNGGLEALTPRQSEVDREEATINPTSINWEHHGPASWLSICSEPGMRWVSGSVGDSTFPEVAQGLIRDWTKHLTLSQHRFPDSGPELDSETAWRYCKSYFNTAQDTAFGVVDQIEFEEHLQVHFQGGSINDEDAATYALRNAVYAVGCRVTPKHGPREFSQSREDSLQLFFNAFSVFPDLLFMPSGLRAVQALVVMTSYAELLGSPSVEYMLCGAAARLAQSKGLHRQPSGSWSLPEREILHRNCIFWAIYCYDKALALRCGRPSMLEDDEISCGLPAASSAGDTLDLEVLNASIEHAQICSDIFKILYSVKSAQQSLESLFQRVKGIESRLEDWRASLPDRLSVQHKSSATSRGDLDKSRSNAIRLFRAYNGSMIALHSSFHYPWIRSRSRTHGDGPPPDAASTSSSRAAAAARLILSSLDDSAHEYNFSAPTAFYFPMLAIINLFVYVLKYPTLATVHSDVALLDIGAGHFGQIHRLTSGHVSFQFPREVSVLASKAVQRAAARIPEDTAAAMNGHDAGNIHNNLDETDFLGANFSPGQWSALSADFFNELAIDGEMIML